VKPINKRIAFSLLLSSLIFTPAMVFGTPTITSVPVNYAIAQITINGTNFGTNGIVSISSTELVIVSWTNTKIKATLPSAQWKPGTFQLTLQVTAPSRDKGTTSWEISLAPRTIHGGVPGDMEPGSTVYTSADTAYTYEQPTLGNYTVTFTEPFEAVPDCIVSSAYGGEPSMPGLNVCNIYNQSATGFDVWCGSPTQLSPTNPTFFFLCAESQLGE
jgi:hypothetical protein